jgi:hypothetical protein
MGFADSFHFDPLKVVFYFFQRSSFENAILPRTLVKPLSIKAALFSIWGKKSTQNAILLPIICGEAAFPLKVAAY